MATLAISYRTAQCNLGAALQQAASVAEVALSVRMRKTPFGSAAANHFSNQSSPDGEASKYTKSAYTYREVHIYMYVLHVLMFGPFHGKLI